MLLSSDCSCPRGLSPQPSRLLVRREYAGHVAGFTWLNGWVDRTEEVVYLDPNERVGRAPGPPGSLLTQA